MDKRIPIMSEVEWTTKQLAYIEAKANPTEKRTNVQIATDMNLTDRTLRRWQNEPGFWDAVYDRAMFYLESSLPAVLNSLSAEARIGNVNAIKLLLQHTGKLIEKVEIDHRLGVQVLVVTAEFDVTGQSALPEKLKPKELKSVV